MFQKRGAQNRTRYVSINNLVNSLGNGVCNSLIGVHAFTECDTVSSFSGPEKVTALKLLLKEDSFQEAFCEMGKMWIVNAKQLRAFEKFACSMHAANINTTGVNELRFQLCCVKKGYIESSRLPPRRNCLTMHVIQANYQTGIWWHRSLQPCSFVSNSSDHAWAMVDDKLAVRWMNFSFSSSGHSIRTIGLQMFAVMQASTLFLPCQWFAVHQHVQFANMR